MAIYHLHSGFVSRSSGRTSVQSAAYICGEKLHEDYRDQIVDFTKRSHDVISYKTIVPDNCKYRGLNIWNEIENFENRYADNFFKNEFARERFKESAQTAQTFVVALPNELGGKIGEELVEKFVETRFISRNLVTTYAIHKASGNWHAHIQVSRRAIAENGDFALRKDREICTKSALLETRKLWADLTNEFLEREGFKERITEKSFEALGINLESSRHRGWYADAIGADSRIVQENIEITRKNEEQILADPSIILDYLNEKRAVFSQKDILAEVGKRIFDPQKVAVVFEKVLDDAIFVGENSDGQFLYTGEKYKQLESEVFSKFDVLKERKGDFGAKNVERLLTEKYGYLSNSQQSAVKGLCNERAVSVLLGKAGAGKTTAMRAVAEAYVQNDRRVIGMSLSAVAAENLGKDAGIESQTIASWSFRWRAYEAAREKFLSFDSMVTDGVLKQFDWYQDLQKYEHSQLKSGDVIIVDEAGMIGTKEWREIFSAAEKFGAKLIAIGDDNQFKPISAGDCFKKFVEQERVNGKLLELGEIRRQNYDWMRTASIEFSRLNINGGLEFYERHEKIHEFKNSREIAQKFVEIEGQGSAAVLCFSNRECDVVNTATRTLKKENGSLGVDIVRINDKGFAIGDQLIFLENNKQFNIKNGQVGEVIGFDKGVLDVKTETGNRKISIEEYNKFNYAYAITLYKSQGKTYDNTILLANKNMDAKAVYVGMTRHRENVDLYYKSSDFSSFKELTSNLSKYSNKDSVADFCEVIENQNKIRVAEYQSLQREIATVLCDINRGEADWKEYHALKHQFVELGREILDNFPAHKLYLEQIGFTREKIEISAGLKQRPLSNIELNAKKKVDLYAKISWQTRETFKKMKSEYFNVAKHPKYSEYCEIRSLRNDLAREILANYPLHREFVNITAREFFISKKTMEKQVEYEDSVLKKSVKSVEERNDIISKIEQYQNTKERFALFKDISSREVIANADHTGSGTLYELNKSTYRDANGFGLHVSGKMVKNYLGVNALEVKYNFGIAEYASMIAEKLLVDRQDKSFAPEIIEKGIKQALCFEIFKEISIQSSKLLDQENIIKLHQKANVLAEHLNDKNIQILNDQALMKEAFEQLSAQPEHVKNIPFAKTSLTQNEIQQLITIDFNNRVSIIREVQQEESRSSDLQI